MDYAAPPGDESPAERRFPAERRAPRQVHAAWQADGGDDRSPSPSQGGGSPIGKPVVRSEGMAAAEAAGNSRELGSWPASLASPAAPEPSSPQPHGVVTLGHGTVRRSGNGADGPHLAPAKGFDDATDRSSGGDAAGGHASRPRPVSGQGEGYGPGAGAEEVKREAASAGGDESDEESLDASHSALGRSWLLACGCSEALGSRLNTVAARAAEQLRRDVQRSLDSSAPRPEGALLRSWADTAHAAELLRAVHDPLRTVARGARRSEASRGAEPGAWRSRPSYQLHRAAVAFVQSRMLRHFAVWFTDIGKRLLEHVRRVQRRAPRDRPPPPLTPRRASRRSRCAARPAAARKRTCAPAGGS